MLVSYQFSSTAGKIVYHNDSMRYPPGYYEQQLNFDFFNYAGIHRPVFLYTTPRTFIDDITISTGKLEGSTAHLYYSVKLRGANKTATSVTVGIYDAKHQLVAQAKNSKGVIMVDNANLWWPRGMNKSVGYLYTLQVRAWNRLSSFWLILSSIRLFNQILKSGSSLEYHE